MKCPVCETEIRPNSLVSAYNLEKIRIKFEILKKRAILDFLKANTCEEDDKLYYIPKHLLEESEHA